MKKKNPTKELPCCKNGKRRTQSSSPRSTVWPTVPSCSSSQWSQGRGPGGSRWQQPECKEHFMMPAVVITQAGVTMIALEDMCWFKGPWRGWWAGDRAHGTVPASSWRPALLLLAKLSLPPCQRRTRQTVSEIPWRWGQKFNFLPSLLT